MMALAFCSCCSMSYLSLPLPGRSLWELDEEELAAAEYLAQECPDHAHCFVLS